MVSRVLSCVAKIRYSLVKRLTNFRQMGKRPTSIRVDADETPLTQLESLSRLDLDSDMERTALVVDVDPSISLADLVRRVAFDAHARRPFRVPIA